MKPRRTAEDLARTAGWVAGLAILLAVPKCVLCVAGYLGLGIALGIGSAALCGNAPGFLGCVSPLLLGQSLALTGLGIVLLWRSNRARRGRTSPAGMSELVICDSGTRETEPTLRVLSPTRNGKARR